MIIRDFARQLLVFIPAILIISLLYGFVMPWHTRDVDRFLLPWLDHILANGPIRSLGQEFSNYSPPYIYIISAASMLYPLVSKLYVIKLVSILGSVALSAAVYWLVRHFRGPRSSSMAATFLLFVPTVWLNGPLWGQCDAFWAAADIVALAAALRGRWVVMASAIGIALSMKLQAIFMAPIIIYLVTSGRMSWKILPVPAVAYIAMLTPAWMAGRSAGSLLSVYSGQAHYYTRLSKGAPNAWTYIEGLDLVSYSHGVLIGGSLAVMVCVVMGFLGLRSKFHQSPALLPVALFAATALPYVLPKMHDRYFFLADVLGYACAVIYPSRRACKIAVFIQLGSVFACAHYLFHLPAGAPIGAIFTTVALILIVRDILKAACPNLSNAGTRKAQLSQKLRGVPRKRAGLEPVRDGGLGSV